VLTCPARSLNLVVRRMLQLRTALASLLVTTVFCNVVLWCFRVPSFFGEPDPNVYGFDGPVYYSITDVPHVAIEVMIPSALLGLGAFLGALLVTSASPITLRSRLCAAALSLMSVFVFTVIIDLAPYKWWAWMPSFGVVYAYIVSGLQIVLPASIATWLWHRRVVRRVAACA
jgi:hypothetical protein